MEIIYLLIPLSLVLLIVAIWAFFWAAKSGQFDDLDSPGLSILDDPLSLDDSEGFDDSAVKDSDDSAP